MENMRHVWTAVETRESVTAAQMKEIERKADEAGLSYYQMMENAGTGAAALIDDVFPVSGKTVLIVCGKGNNGGDGFVVARKFKEWGAIVNLILAEGEPKTDDARKNWQLCENMAIPMIAMNGLGEASQDRQERLSQDIMRYVQESELIIDAIYGTGFHGALREPVRTLARQINSAGTLVWALDIPSGLNGDSSEADEDTICADGTVAFHRIKPAHADAGSRKYCGRVSCISIGIEGFIAD